MKFFECFAGIGGFRLGLEQAGFECVGSCEIDKHANSLYHNYFKTQGEYFEDDIKKIDAKKNARIRHLVRGIPVSSILNRR